MDLQELSDRAEIYDVLVLQRNWPPHEFARFIADFMITGLLPTANGT